MGQGVELCSDPSLGLTLQYYTRFSSNEVETIHWKKHIEMLLCYPFFLRARRLRPLILHQSPESQTTEMGLEDLAPWAKDL